MREALLFITWNMDPEIFSLGPLSIRYYGLTWALAFLLGYLIFKHFSKVENLPASFLDSLTMYMIIGTIIGSRLGHCLFYDPGFYLKHPLEILKIWHGGLASHGAAIGILIALYLFARKWKVPMIYVVDRVVILVALGGALVRLGNFMNSEIYGNVTNLPWGVLFVRAGELFPRHPTQIYEATAYILLWIPLMIYYNRKKGQMPIGLVFGIFLIVLFGARFFIEFIKEPQVDFEKTMTLNMGQILSIPFIAAGIYFIINALRKPRFFKYTPSKRYKTKK